ncbi:hypothetical protein ACT03S_26875, partial [Klebsiella pneumoniae]
MDMMLFFRKYGFLFIPPVYWLIYLGARLTYNGLAGEFSPDFLQGIRKRLVRTVLIFTESSDQLSRATDRVP